jgi:hypothetical protein
MFQPWYYYARQQGRNYGLWYCLESGPRSKYITPKLTYNGKGKKYMEDNHTGISLKFMVPSINGVFRGPAIHSYVDYTLMS